MDTEETMEGWGDDRGITFGHVNTTRARGQRETDSYYLSNSYYLYGKREISRSSTGALPGEFKHREAYALRYSGDNHVIISMEKEDVGKEFPKEFPRRRQLSTDASLGSINNGFLRQVSDGSMESKVTDLGKRRSSQSAESIPQLKINRGNSLSRRMSTFATSHVSQKFTDQAKKAVSNFSSVSYSPTHSITYMDWVREQTHKMGAIQWDRWFLTFWIGIITGLIGVLLNQCLQALGGVKWSRTQDYMGEDNLLKTWGWTVGISLVYVLISSVLVAFVHPPAAGGGTPEVLAYLNGVIIHNVFGLKNLIIKFTSNVFAVSSGLPCAIQGPIIAYGAIVGKGIGQFRSSTLSCAPKCFTRFRNAIDRRSFTTAGVAAGVAAAFNAPLGGLLFAMEDLSSFWSKQLSWQVFFSSVIATGVAGLFNTAFNGFKFDGAFGMFTLSITEPIQIHVALVCAAIALGLVGGVMGSIFTLLNTRVVGKARKLVLTSIKQPVGVKIARVAETVILAIAMSAYHSVLPVAFDCSNLADVNQNITRVVTECLEGAGVPVGNTTSPIKLVPYNCRQPEDPGYAEFYYNEIATVIQNGGQAQLNILWSRGTHYFFKWYTPLVLFACWFPMSIWTLGSCIAGGIFVPTLISGSLYGRAVGSGMLALYRKISGFPMPVETTWAWIDPGLMAAIGAGSLLGGVTRLALASTVIVVEMTQDINLVIPILIAVFVAKMVADLISKPLYKCQLDAKTLPYLEQEPQVALEGQIVNLELFKASDVMSSPVRTIRAVESLYSLSQLLTSTQHEGFPVVKRDFETGLDVCYGMITRNELYVIMFSDSLYEEKTPNSVINPDNVLYDELSQDYISDDTAKYERVKTFGHFDVYKLVYVNLDPFINISVTKVDGDFSLHRTYQLFRTLGLRHLVVIDIRNQPIGMITRQDLMAFNIQDRLSSIPSGLALDALMSQSDTSSSGSSESGSTFEDKSDIVLPAITIPSISTKVDTIREVDEIEDNEQDTEGSDSQSSTASDYSGSLRSSRASTRSRTSQHSRSHSSNVAFPIGDEIRSNPNQFSDVLVDGMGSPANNNINVTQL